MRTLLVLIVSLLPFISCSPSVPHEKREWPLENALDRQRVESDTILPIRIGLRQNNEALATAEKWLMDVSDPYSPTYGRHWTQTEVIKAFQPSHETVKAVADWLSENRIQFTHSDNKQWFAFNLAASRAEQLFQTEYFEHRTENGTFEVSCDQYFVPEGLEDRIDFVTPGIKSKQITFRSKRSREHHGIKDTQNAARDAAHKDHVTQIPPYPTPSKTIEAKRSYNFTVSSGISYQIPKHTTPPYPPNDLEHCHRSVSPACIRALYGFDLPSVESPPLPNNTLGIFENWELAYQSDLNKFWRYYTHIPPGTKPIYDSIDGAITIPAQTNGWTKNYTDGEPPGEVFASESPFDYQLALPIIYPQNVTTFQSDDPYWAATEENRKFAGIFNDFLDAIDGSYCTFKAYNVTGNSPQINPQYPDPRKHGWDHPLQCGVFKPTSVISMSYGIDELQLPGPYLKRQCLEYLKLGLQGVSFFASSGDLGVGRCTRGPAGSRLFGPQDPVGCPWVTGAGASRVRRDWVPGDPAQEVAAGFSGGGFSVYHERPAYQDATVTEYLTKYPPGIPYFYNGHYGNSTGRYNRNGRGIPDVSAVGFNIASISGGKYGKGFGTSAAAPIVAALFNRINEERLRIGKGPVGFVNPTLYKHPYVMNDINVGHNALSCNAGFRCEPGWDAVSGLGTPNYPKMLKLFLSLP